MSVDLKPKISPKEYSQILSGVELEEMHLESVSTKLNRSEAGLNLNVLTNMKTPEFQVFDGGFSVIVPIQLRAKNNSRKVVIKIDAEFYLKFSSEEEVTEDFFDVYKRQSLRLNTWPYFRELVSSLTAKMGFSPLTLPLHK